MEFVLYSVLLIVLAWGPGSRFAQTQTYFLVPVCSPKTVVVIRISGERGGENEEGIWDDSTD